MLSIELKFNNAVLKTIETDKEVITIGRNVKNDIQIDNLSVSKQHARIVKHQGKYFIEDMKKVFPTLKDDWGIYVPEVKYLSPEPLVDYTNLALTKYPNVHFVGDALSARGITVSGAQGTYVAEHILKN